MLLGSFQLPFARGSAVKIQIDDPISFEWNREVSRSTSTQSTYNAINSNQLEKFGLNLGNLSPTSHSYFLNITIRFGNLRQHYAPFSECKRGSVTNKNAGADQRHAICASLRQHFGSHWRVQWRDDIVRWRWSPNVAFTLMLFVKSRTPPTALT